MDAPKADRKMVCGCRTSTLHAPRWCILPRIKVKKSACTLFQASPRVFRRRTPWQKAYAHTVRTLTPCVLTKGVRSHCAYAHTVRTPISNSVRTVWAYARRFAPHVLRSPPILSPAQWRAPGKEDKDTLLAACSSDHHAPKQSRWQTCAEHTPLTSYRIRVDLCQVVQHRAALGCIIWPISSNHCLWVNF